MNTTQLNPHKIPRPYPMVAAMFQDRTGKKLTPAGVRNIELRALAKMRNALQRKDD